MTLGLFPFMLGALPIQSVAVHLFNFQFYFFAFIIIFFIKVSLTQNVPFFYFFSFCIKMHLDSAF